MILYHTVLILFFLNMCRCKSYYTAAVVEYHPYSPTKPVTNEEIVSRNVDNYLKLIDETCKTNKIDIMVFPESTLFFRSKIDKQSDLSSVATQIGNNNNTKGKEWFLKLSQSAQKHQIYLSVNLIEQTENSEYFNTNVVFDRNGVPISRYRKFNLFNEPFINTTKNAEISTFKTDFNVEFGVFICFDVYFEKPAEVLVGKGIRHFIMPSFWYSQLPFLTSMQGQKMWSHKHNVVLLASGANNPETSTSGSGIYLGNGNPATSIFTSDKKTKVLLANVPLDLETSNFTVDEFKHERKIDSFPFWKDNLTSIQSELLSPLKQNYDFFWPNSSEFCSIHIKAKNREEKDDFVNNYFLMAANDSCALVLCPGNSSASCNEYPREDFSNNIEIETIHLKILHRRKGVVHFPTMILRDLRFADSDEYVWSKDEMELDYKSIGNINDIYVFGIYGTDRKKKW